MNTNKKVEEDSVLLTKRQVASRCHVCLSTVHAWLERNLLGYVKIGRVVRIPRRDLDAFIEKQRIGRPLA